MIVTVVKDEIKEKKDCRSTTPIGYVLGDNPFEKSMDSYVTVVWGFVSKP